MWSHNWKYVWETHLSLILYLSLNLLNILLSVRKLCQSRRSWLLKQDNVWGVNDTSKSTQEWIRWEHWAILRCPAMSPYLSPLAHQRKELTPSVGRRDPSNLRELEQFAREEFAKLPSIEVYKSHQNYRKLSIAVIASKGCRCGMDTSFSRS